MSDIAIVVTSSFHRGYLPQILAEHNASYPVYGPNVGVLSEPEALKRAREAIRDGAKVLIATGRTPEQFSQALPVPVVTLKYSVISVARAVTAARKISKTVGCFCRYGRLYQTILKYKTMFRDKLLVAGYEDESNAATALEYLQANHVEAIVCGGRGGALAEKFGFPFRCVRVTYEDNDVLDCVSEAENLLQYTRQSMRQTAVLRAVQEKINLGVMALDAEGRVLEANSEALTLVGAPFPELAQDGLSPELKQSLAELREGPDSRGLITWNGHRLVAGLSEAAPDPDSGLRILTLMRTENLQSEMRQMVNWLYEPVKAFPQREVLEEPSQSAAYRSVLHEAELYAAVNTPVLITGELGSGKSLFAQRIHAKSPRSGMPFVQIPCGAYSGEALKARLFGSGAGENAFGELELANGGTVYLNGVESLPLELQTRLVHVLQTHELREAGSGRSVRVDLRFIASTRHSLARLQEEGKLLEEFYYLISALHLEVPPLSRRREDIPLLLERFLEEAARNTGRDRPPLTEAALAYLTKIEYPGNLYQLSGLAQRMLLLAEGGPIDLPLAQAAVGGREPVPSRPASVRAERELDRILDALACCGGNRKQTAQRLGMSTSTLWRKMKKYHLQEQNGDLEL